MPKGSDSQISLTLVVAAVIRDSEGRILLTRRPEGRHMEGLWEFPGGKVAEGESPADALIRELHEELGLETRTGAPITFAVHEEPGLRILLLFFSSEIIAGTPAPREGQEIVWVRPQRLPSYPTPPADADLVARLARDPSA
jgi:8-oxo-dGTP diphosphatase